MKGTVRAIVLLIFLAKEESLCDIMYSSHIFGNLSSIALVRYTLDIFV